MLNVIKKKVASFNDKDKDCILCFNEIALKCNLFYNRTADEVVGFHEVLGTKSFRPVNSALIIMTRGVYQNWKQPIGYFLINNVCSSEDLKNVIFTAISHLQDTGLNVV
ncbi:hypothetical protein ILUMI_11375, partial [Ignelater luminosus]